VKFGHVVFESCEWTDRPTDTEKLIAILCTAPGAKVKIIIQLNGMILAALQQSNTGGVK